MVETLKQPKTNFLIEEINIQPITPLSLNLLFPLITMTTCSISDALTTMQS